jgi:hypothetical protein
MSEALKQVYKEQDEKDHEISMARGELEAIADKATQLAGALQGKSDEGNPLEAWVQSKITKAKDYINSVSDYLMYNPDMKQNEETELEEGFSSSLKQKAKEIAKKFANNMTKAVDEIEKLAKGLSDEPEVYKTIKQYNEEIEVDEKISDIFKANKEGESIDDIAKRLKLSTSMVKKLIGEAKDEEEKKEEPKKEENKESEIQSLKGQIAMLKQKLENEKNKAIKPEPNPETGEVPLTIGVAHAEFKKKKEEVKEENLQELSKAERDKRIQRAKDMIKYYDAQKKAALKGPNKALAKKMLKNEKELEEVTQKEIDKFHTDLDNLVHKTFGHSSDEKKKEKMDEKVADSIIKDLQKAYAPMKGKTISPEMANKISKHLNQPSYDLNVLRQLKKANIPFISTIARNKIYKKTGKFEDRRLYVEGIAGLQKKADKSGMPYNILKQVYDRGMAAWKSGHRPGASQQQWAFARVNSFITKSSGTWGGADKDLAAKVKGSK